MAEAATVGFWSRILRTADATLNRDRSDTREWRERLREDAREAGAAFALYVMVINLLTRAVMELLWLGVLSVFMSAGLFLLAVTGYSFVLHLNGALELPIAIDDRTILIHNALDPFITIIGFGMGLLTLFGTLVQLAKAFRSRY